MKFDRKMLLLYGVTDRNFTGRQSILEQVEEALKGGVTLIQLREKDLSEEKFLQEAVKVKALCSKYQVPLIINDNVEVALRSGADGVHVGIEDMEVSEIRAKAPKDFIIGATAKTVSQAQAAEKAGADYLGVGAVFPSPTKAQAVRITAGQLREIIESVDIPAVAIGGITADNLQELAGSGADGIAVVSSLFGAEDVKAAAECLKVRTKAALNL